MCVEHWKLFSGETNWLLCSRGETQQNNMTTSRRASSSASFSARSNDRSSSSNLESFACFWLDENVNSTQDNRETHRALRRVINHLRTFNNTDACEQCIREITREKVILIVSGTLGSRIVPHVHGLPQLSACYVFCRDRQRNEQWARNYDKVSL